MAGKDTEEKGGAMRFIYNPDTGEVLGRTGSSWFKITVFYIIFFICLAAFWAVMLIIFYQTLDAFVPKWTLDASLIGTVPGLGFRPRPPMDNIDSTLIYFKAGGSEQASYKNWVDDLKNFTESYKPNADTISGEHLVDCNLGRPSEDIMKTKACAVPYEQFVSGSSNCSIQEEFGYKYGTPCVALKINKIYGWIPEPYNNNFPEKTPNEVKKDYKPDKILITCEGENAADQENMGPVVFHPNPYIDSKYYPYTNVDGYKVPFVFAQFTKPERGVLINVECKAWSKNIIHDRQERIGSVHFEIMID